jgi:hypothetical protein
MRCSGHIYGGYKRMHQWRNKVQIQLQYFYVQTSQRDKQYGMSIYSWELMYTIQEFVKSDVNLVKTLQVIG